MKRIGLLICTIIMGLGMVHAENNDVHLHKLIEALNGKNLSQTRKELPLVTNWQFYGPDQRCWIFDDLGAISVVEKLKPTSKITQQSIDSLWIYLCNQETMYAKLFLVKDNYQRAKEAAEFAFEHQKKILGEQHPDFARTLGYLGKIYYAMGDFYGAAESFLWEYQIYSQIYDNDSFDHHHAEFETTLSDLGTLYLTTGDYSRAETCLLSALEFARMDSAQRGKDYGTACSNVATLYMEKGDFQKAERYLLQSIEMLRIHDDQESPRNYISSIGNYGVFCGEIGNYPQAIRYLQEALELCEKKLGKNNLSYAHLLENLSALYNRISNYPQAEKLALQVLDIIKPIVDEKNPFYAQVLSNLGMLYLSMEDYPNAMEYMYDAFEIHKKYRKGTVDYALSLNNIGTVSAAVGDFEESEQYYSEALTIYEETFGKNNPNYTRTLENLGMLYYLKQDFSQAAIKYAECSQIRKEQFLNTLTYMSEQQRVLYWELNHHFFEEIVTSLYYKYSLQKRSISIDAYNNELFTKGLLLSSSNAVKRSVLESDDTTLIRQWEDLTTRKQQIMVLEEKYPNSDYLAEIRAEAETLEKEITRSSAAYRENLQQWSITWDSVKAALKPDQVAIEYMSAPLNEDSTMYCALLLRDTCSMPILIPLFEEKEVAGLLNTSTADSANIRRTYAYSDNGQKLSTIIWQHITPYLNADEEVFFSPTGVLHQIAIENLPFDSSRIMAEEYNLVRVSSTRELALHQPTIPHEKAALYGNIYYTADEKTMLANHQTYQKLELPEDIMLASNIRSVPRGNVEDLPGTKKEIDAISPILREKQISVQTFTAFGANEESLKSLSGTHQNILHLATHGFYWPVLRHF